MFCEPYRKALSEAALAGERASGEAAAHLDHCAGCRRDFAQERALVQRIDAALGSLAAADVPASLVPGVRARIAAGTGSPAAFWLRASFLPGAAALAVVLIGISFAMRYKTPQAGQAAPARASSPAVPSPALAAPLKPGGVRPPERFSQREGMSAGSTRRTQGSERNAGAEILISADDRLGLERYAASLRTDGARTAATVKEEDGAGIKPLEIAQLQARRLSIEPLDGGSN